MVKTLAEIEKVIDGKIGRFLLDADTSLPVAKELCLEFLKHIGKIEDQVKEMEAKQAEQKAKEEADKAASEQPAVEVQPE